jgi:hypothetical protein
MGMVAASMNVMANRFGASAASCAVYVSKSRMSAPMRRASPGMMAPFQY